MPKTGAKCAKFARLSGIMRDRESTVRFRDAAKPVQTVRGVDQSAHGKIAKPHFLESQYLGLLENRKRLAMRYAKAIANGAESFKIAKLADLIRKTDARMASIVTELKTQGRDIYS